MSFEIVDYDVKYQKKWDEFVIKESMNGTFLQTRKFIEYHPKDRFKDCSLVVLKGNQIVACILACEIVLGGKVTFYSHKGTTFGGLIISPNIYNASCISELLDKLDMYLYNKKYEQVYFKMTPSVFTRENTELLDYFLFQREYQQYNELNYYLKLDNYRNDILKNFSASKRRDYRYSLKNSLKFNILNDYNEIKEFYGILLSNLEKFGASCVHSLNDLMDLKFNRFKENIEFYGVYLGEKMIAGSMIFMFDERVMHTQYLVSDRNYLNFYSMDFLMYNLIEIALEKKKKYFTLGICTENEGKYLNMGLSRFKEGFGTDYCVNRTYFKTICNGI